MTLDLRGILYHFAAVLPQRRRAVPALDLRHMGARDIADLNLPGDVSARLMARDAHEARRRVFM